MYYECTRHLNSARVRKPFEVVSCDNTTFLNWQAHFSKFFKKSIKTVKKVKVMEYSSTHPSEVWVNVSTTQLGSGTSMQFSSMAKHLSSYPPTVQLPEVSWTNPI